MMDSNYVDRDGKCTPVSQLSDELIEDLLKDDLGYLNGDMSSVHWIHERLKIEQTIRKLGLWLPQQ